MNITKKIVFTLSLCALSAQLEATDSVVRKLDFSKLAEESDGLPVDPPYFGTQTNNQIPSGKEAPSEHAPEQVVARSIFDVTEEEVEAELPEALQFLYEGPHHTFYDPITRKMIQGKVFESTPDGDCGYTSMFLERATAIDNTLEMSGNMLVRSLVHKRFVKDKASFEEYVGDARDDSSNYLQLETNVRYNRLAQDGEQRLSRLDIPVQNDLIGGVSFANNRHVVGLLHDREPESDTSLFPCHISKNFMNPSSRLVYLLFEGGGYHGNRGLHYNIVMPTAQPDSIPEEQYKENVVIAWRAHNAALTYMEMIKQHLAFAEVLLLDQAGEEDAKAWKQIEEAQKKKAGALSTQGSDSELESKIENLKKIGLNTEQIETILAITISSRMDPIIDPVIDLSTPKSSGPKKAPRPNSKTRESTEKEAL